MKVIFQRPYLYWLVGVFLVYLALNVYISRFYETVQYLGVYASQVHWGKLILGMVFTLVISGLVAVNSVYGYIQYKEEQRVTKKSGIVACVGTIGGLATGVCSSCVASVFPLVLGLFGVTFSFAVLPFQGLEVQVMIIILLGISLYWLRKRR